MTENQNRKNLWKYVASFLAGAVVSAPLVLASNYILQSRTNSRNLVRDYDIKESGKKKIGILDNKLVEYNFDATISLHGERIKSDILTMTSGDKKLTLYDIIDRKKVDFDSEGELSLDGKVEAVIVQKNDERYLYSGYMVDKTSFGQCADKHLNKGSEVYNSTLKQLHNQLKRERSLKECGGSDVLDFFTEGKGKNEPKYKLQPPPAKSN